MKKSISEKVKMISTFVCILMVASTFTASCLFFITENYGSNIQNEGLNKGETATMEMQESTNVFYFKFLLF